MMLIIIIIVVVISTITLIIKPDHCFSVYLFLYNNSLFRCCNDLWKKIEIRAHFSCFAEMPWFWHINIFKKFIIAGDLSI